MLAQCWDNSGIHAVPHNEQLGSGTLNIIIQRHTRSAPCFIHSVYSIGNQFKPTQLLYKLSLTHSFPKRQKQHDTFNDISQAKSKARKIFLGEMSFGTLPTTLLQILYKTILHFKVIVKSIIDPDYSSRGNSLSINGLNTFPV